ncbi:MAG: hypothetical protein ABIG61_14390 [Planctomycetota bacterium]
MEHIRSKGRNKRHSDTGRQEMVLPAGEQENERKFNVAALLILLLFGIYQSILYFGYKVVPNSDFPDFIRTGHELLSLKWPTSFNRAPVLGILQAFLSRIVGGSTPDLTGARLLNALLHPPAVVLMWLVGKKIIGRSAFWLTLIAMINPYVLQMLGDPIAETTLLFFVLLTFYFIFRRSGWAYLFASITMMVRYEGAALIMAAFVMDMIYGENRRRRIYAFLYSVLAAVPLVLWLGATALDWKSQGQTHYLAAFKADYGALFAEPVEERTGWLLHMKLLWQVAFRSLFITTPGASQSTAQILQFVSRSVVALVFAWGVIYGLYRRQWKILALLLFFLPYFWVHQRYPFPALRFHTTIFWIPVLICWYGIKSAWGLINTRNIIWVRTVIAIQFCVILITVVWFVPLLAYMEKLAVYNPASKTIPYAVVGAACIMGLYWLYLYKSREMLTQITIIAILCLIVVSNQFYLVSIVGDGQNEKEFKLLADWYVKNTNCREKLAVYMYKVIELFAPAYKQNFLALPKADNAEEFVKLCRQNKIVYVVWASREGLKKHHEGYRSYNLHITIPFLAYPKNNGPYQFVTQLGSKRGFVNVFRLADENHIISEK